MTIILTLTTAGENTGHFDLYSNINGFTIPFELGVDKTFLQAGYSTSLAPDFTTIVRVQSATEYCTNYIDIILEECTRPEDVINIAFENSYTPDGGITVDFTGSFLEACAALYDFNTIPGGQINGSTKQTLSLTVGNIVYAGTTTDCTFSSDGFFITDMATGEITEIVGGVITSITYC